MLEELVARRWQLGGEGSGHLLALDKHTTGDGIVSALMVLQSACRRDKPLAELLSDVQLFPQTLINVQLAPGTDWRKSTRLADAQADVDRELAGDGRVLIRPSGTEPVVRVMVEARDADLARRSAQRLAAALG